MKREASKVQFVQMYAGHPHFGIKAVPLAEIHQLQVRLKKRSLLSSSAVLILMSRMKLIFVHFLKDIGRCFWCMPSFLSGLEKPLPKLISRRYDQDIKIL